MCTAAEFEFLPSVALLGCRLRLSMRVVYTHVGEKRRGPARATLYFFVITGTDVG
jgi:hypothetical protein